MNIFLLLVLAHLIADFPLQTNFIFKARNKFKYGGLLHILMHTISNIFFLTPYLLYYQTWLGICGIILSHFFIDKMKKENIYKFALDQILHIMIIIIVSIGLKGLKPAFIYGDIDRFFFNNKLLLIIIGFILSTFFSTILIYFIKLTWFKNYGKTPIETYEKLSGFLDRGFVYLIVVLSLFYKKYYFLSLGIIPFMIRIFIWARMRGDEKGYKNIYLADIIIGFLITLLISGGIYSIIEFYPGG
jgi:hypothetical protein